MTWGGPSILPSCSLSTDRVWERKGLRSNRMIPEIEQTCQESGSYNSRVFEGQEAPLWLWGVWVCGEADYPVTLSLPAMFGWHILLTGSLQGKRTMIRWSRRGFVADPEGSLRTYTLSWCGERAGILKGAILFSATITCLCFSLFCQKERCFCCLWPTFEL